MFLLFRFWQLWLLSSFILKYLFNNKSGFLQNYQGKYFPKAVLKIKEGAKVVVALMLGLCAAALNHFSLCHFTEMSRQTLEKKKASFCTLASSLSFGLWRSGDFGGHSPSRQSSVSFKWKYYLTGTNIPDGAEILHRNFHMHMKTSLLFFCSL